MASQMRLKAFLTAFEMRLRCVCGNAFYKRDGQGHPEAPQRKEEKRKE